MLDYNQDIFLNSPEWRFLCAQEQLNTLQQNQFACYLNLLRDWNAKFNITAITDPAAIITDHFQDSLRVRHLYPFDKLLGIGDIGSGGGFPGIPLKICYPEIPFVLIEVNNKKIQFLETVIQTLNLSRIEVCPLDWRTFLRQSTYSLSLFIARASLQPEDLIRIFKPSCHYRNATVLYWASQTWSPSTTVAPFIKTRLPYTVHNTSKQRKIIVLKAPEAQFYFSP